MKNRKQPAVTNLVNIWGRSSSTSIHMSPSLILSYAYSQNTRPLLDVHKLYSVQWLDSPGHGRGSTTLPPSFPLGRDGYPGENRGECDMDTFTPEKHDISCFWMYHIISIPSGIYGDIGYISDIACDIPECNGIYRTYHMIHHWYSTSYQLCHLIPRYYYYD